MFETIQPYLARIIFSLVIIFAVYILKKFLTRKINAKVSDIRIRHNYRKLTVYILGFFLIVILGGVWIRKISFGVVFSIIGAGLVVALGDFILSFCGWFFLIIRRPFEIGDRIQLGQIKGDVVDIRAFYVALLEIENWVEGEQSTGRVVYIPNNFIFKKAIYNYTRGFNFIWNEVKVVITFESNIDKAKEICLKALDNLHNSWAKNLEEQIRQAQREFAISYSKLTPTVYVKIIDSGVLLCLRYLIPPHSRRDSENRLYTEILNSFNREEDITFAYTTYRIVK